MSDGMTGKERAGLRAHANRLPATVHVGAQGLTTTLRQSLDDALRTRELVKIQFSKNADNDAKQAANEIAASSRADVVQVIGKTATLYRPNPELPRKDGVPPWRK